MDAQRQQIRLELEAERERLLGRHAKLEAHLQNTDREVPADWEERGAFLQNDEVLEGLEVHARERVAEIDAALAHIADPDWGVCTCGKRIAAARMQALPTATLCIRCASGAER